MDGSQPYPAAAEAPAAPAAVPGFIAIHEHLSRAFAAYIDDQGVAEAGDAEELLTSGVLTADQTAWVSAFVRLWDATTEVGQ